MNRNLAILVDVDNTLIDNDGVKNLLQHEICAMVGTELDEAFWTTYESVRQERDYVDFLETLETFRRQHPEAPNFPQLAAQLMCFPYSDSLYPDALGTLRHFNNIATAAIVSDGDPVFQPAKIWRAGLAQAVEGRVHIFTHKATHLAAVAGQMGCERYVMVDDKPDILADAREADPDNVFTIHVRQGKYGVAASAEADLSVAAIADLNGLDPADIWRHFDRD